MNFIWPSCIFAFASSEAAAKAMQNKCMVDINVISPHETQIVGHYRIVDTQFDRPIYQRFRRPPMMGDEYGELRYLYYFEDEFRGGMWSFGSNYSDNLSFALSPVNDTCPPLDFYFTFSKMMFIFELWRHDEDITIEPLATANNQIAEPLDTIEDGDNKDSIDEMDREDMKVEERVEAIDKDVKRDETIINTAEFELQNQVEQIKNEKSINKGYRLVGGKINVIKNSPQLQIKTGYLICSLSTDTSQLVSSRFDRARAIGWPDKIRAHSAHDSLVYSACFCRLRCRVRFHTTLHASTQIDNGEQRSTARLWYLLISLQIIKCRLTDATILSSLLQPAREVRYLIVVYIRLCVQLSENLSQTVE